MVEELAARSRDFITAAGEAALGCRVEFSIEARYPNQVWTLLVPINAAQTASPDGVAAIVEAFHAAHEETFAVADRSSAIEIESWHARVSCRLSDPQPPNLPPGTAQPGRRNIYLAGSGWVEADVWRLVDVGIDEPQLGPAIVETETTAVLVDAGATFMRRASGTLHVVPSPADPSTTTREVG